MEELKIFAIELGCTPANRIKEQHDIFFGVGTSINDPGLHQKIREFWPDAGKIHIDAYIELSQVDGYRISIVPKQENDESFGKRLFYLNLGGYTFKHFGEHHKNLFLVEDKLTNAIERAMQDVFIGEMDTPHEKAKPHHDNNKRLADVDGELDIGEYLNQYRLVFTPNPKGKDSVLDPVITGYLKLEV